MLMDWALRFLDQTFVFILHQGAHAHGEVDVGNVNKGDSESRTSEYLFQCALEVFFMQMGESLYNSAVNKVKTSLDSKRGTDQFLLQGCEFLFYESLVTSARPTRCSAHCNNGCESYACCSKGLEIISLIVLFCDDCRNSLFQSVFGFSWRARSGRLSRTEQLGLLP